MLAFGEMLPVVMDGTAVKQDPDPLRSIVRKKIPQPREYLLPTADASATPGTTCTARSRSCARRPSRVRSSTSGSSGTAPKNDRTPWLVRRPFGAGGVTWVAQDLGDPFLTRQASFGWPHVWDRVFDWKNDTTILTNEVTEKQKQEYANAAAVDIGYSLLGIELGSKSLGLMTLAIVFFIGYWLLAGPGVYAYLASKRQTTMSWFWFAAAALAMTGVTVIIVKLTLRGARSCGTLAWCAPRRASPLTSTAASACTSRVMACSRSS
jgi:hypothetical protein